MIFADGRLENALELLELLRLTAGAALNLLTFVVVARLLTRPSAGSLSRGCH
jgi:hypothetical protein